MKNLKTILEKIHSIKELRQTIVPLFVSNPGMGKSYLVHEFAKEKGVNVVEFITSQRNPHEISGIGMPDSDTKKMSIWDFDTLLSMKDGDILFFDELLNGNPTVLNACLTLLEQRRTISGKELPDIMIVAAANPQGMCPLTPQIKERFVWYNLNFDQEMWIQFMIKKYEITYSIGVKLAHLIKEEKFLKNNFNTPRSLDKALNMILNDVPTPYKKELDLILHETIVNTTEEDIIINKHKKLTPNEMIPWIELIKIKRNENITE